MTREEAISVLHKLKPTIRREDGKSTTHILETIALDLAIKVLEQESKTGHWIPCSERLPEERDRNYQVGDLITLREYENGAYTGREIKNLPIYFILRDCPEYGLKDGYCILGL